MRRRTAPQPAAVADCYGDRAVSTPRPRAGGALRIIGLGVGWVVLVVGLADDPWMLVLVPVAVVHGYVAPAYDALRSKLSYRERTVVRIAVAVATFASSPGPSDHGAGIDARDREVTSIRGRRLACR